VKLKVALEVARGTDASIHKMGYACSVEDMRHRALDTLLGAYEAVKLLAHSEQQYFSILDAIELLEKS
jgi:hypothetical protein